MHCDYGCGQQAKYKMTSGKHCCSLHYSSCPALRAKNSKGVAKAHSSGIMKGFTDEDRIKSSESRLNESIENTFVENSTYSTENVKSKLTKHLKWKEVCAECGLGSIWNNKPIVLHLDHINGINTDNRLSNLRFLCPNCHSQTTTYCGKGNTGKIKVSDDQIIDAIKVSTNIRQTLIKVGLTAKGLNYNRVRALMAKHNLEF